MNVFKEYLRLIWMGQYNRGGGIEGSSGLEHVFLGEKNGNSISGYHGWIKYYRDELAGRMNYLGYMTKIDLGVVSLHKNFIEKQGGNNDININYRAL